MGGSTTGDYGSGNSSSVIEGMPDEQTCDSVVEWRSCEQVENGIPSTSLPFWDTDDDDDCGAKPSDLYGKFTWKIGKFSQTDKRDLRSDVFEIGGYKWYILIYPQGCDVSNHLSLFLCVANHDKLLPGWSHFAQFTIAVVNKDPKKSKNSDTLHRFWKKEHDWGWKKFMELSKISDDFIVEDTLVIDAHVQVIRESTHRLFRCLDRHYRRDLVRIYSSNVEQICRRFVEEKRGKLSKLIEDTLRWSSFHSFWVGIDKNAKRRISRDKTDAILKVVVKHFFIEKEVTSTLVMDSLYSGLKAIESQTMNRTGRAKQVDMEELPVPMVCIEKDMFVLADDVLLLLKRTTLEPLPHQPLPPKDDKSPPNCTKDASSGEELKKDSIERDERRLTELGRRTLEIFIITHIFSKIEVAYKEDVALKRQEELIREEEAAGLVENELKAKRGAAEKEKRTKKKQAKPKRNSRKGKDRGRDEKSDVIVQDKHQPEIPSDERILEISSSKEKSAIDKTDTLEDASDVSDTGDDASEALQPELDDRDTVSINSDMDRSETHPVADSCSTFSTNLVPPVVANGSHKQNSLPNSKSQTSPIRVKDQQSKDTQDRTAFVRGENNSSSDATAGAAHLRDDADNCRIPQPEPEAVGFSLKDRALILEQHLVGMEEVVPQQKKSIVREPVEVERPSKPRTAESSSTPSSPVKKPPLASQQSKQSSENTITTTERVSSNNTPSPGPSQTQKSTPLATRSPHVSSNRSEAQKLTTPAKCTSTHQAPPMSRPLSAPIIPSPRTTAPVVSTVQTVPLLLRSLSSAGRLGTDPSPAAPSYVPHSYRNTIRGQATMGTTQAGFTSLTSSTSSQLVAYSQSPSAFVSTGSMLGQTSPRPGYTFGSVKPDALHNQRPWRDDYSRQEANNRSSRLFISNHASDISRLGGHGESRAKQHSGVVSSGVAWGQAHGVMSEEFPHLAIINDLLDEDQCTGKAAHRHHHSFNRQYTFPRAVAAADVGSSVSHCRPDRPEHYCTEGFQGVYGSSSGPLHGLRDARRAQVDRLDYADGQIDGAVRNQWPYRQSNPAMLNSGIVDADGYSYQLQDDSGSTCGENGYIMYRSSSGL